MVSENNAKNTMDGKKNERDSPYNKTQENRKLIKEILHRH